jgi:DNA-binding NtrC family response regulator
MDRRDVDADSDSAGGGGGAGDDADSSIADFYITQAVQSDVCVLLTGPHQAVEALAYRIHSLSGWRHGPFITVNCGWPEAALEHRLFGALNDEADAPRVSAGPTLRLAQAGTVLLQEVGRLSSPFQARLADRLSELRGHGGYARCRRRVMASTSEVLLPRVLDGTFNDQLFYRLNAIHLVVSGGMESRWDSSTCESSSAPV